MEEIRMKNNPPLRKYLMQKAARNRTPLSGTFELTPRCNMNCRMCYIRMSEQEMRERGREKTAEEWIRMGQECVSHGMFLLLLTGGEPFLRPDFREIYTELKKLGLVISINTNGTLIDESVLEWLAKDPPARINVTLYGGNDDTYRRLCRYQGYKAACDAIDRMAAAGMNVNINASFTKYNIADMEQIISFAKKRNLRVNSATYMFPPVRNASGVVDEEVRFTPEECAHARFQSMMLQLSDAERQLMIEAIRQGTFVPPEEAGDCDRSSGEKMGCMAGRSAFWITWDGRMTPCGMMNAPVTHPFENGFSESWKYIAEETDKILLPPECSSCSMRKYCSICGALAVAEGHGDSTKRPMYLCKSTEHYIRLIKEAGEEQCDEKQDR